MNNRQQLILVLAMMVALIVFWLLSGASASEFAAWVAGLLDGLKEVSTKVLTWFVLPLVVCVSCLRLIAALIEFFKTPRNR